MYLYSDLLMAGDEAGAKKALQGVSYPDSLLLLSKAILNAVDAMVLFLPEVIMTHIRYGFYSKRKATGKMYWY